MNTHKNILG